ncbi:unnamed protein product [marine sediment metagenome]|uniref:Uncharacterized protein n=1 Tax=marine sediment metagenome TaxID=412755 RepID=X0ZHN7_9ZZZZ
MTDNVTVITVPQAEIDQLKGQLNAMCTRLGRYENIPDALAGTYVNPRIKELGAENKLLKLTLNGIGNLALWHYDEDAAFCDDSPDDMTAHVNGLIVRLAKPYMEEEVEK